MSWEKYGNYEHPELCDYYTLILGLVEAINERLAALTAMELYDAPEPGNSYRQAHIDRLLAYEPLVIPKAFSAYSPALYDWLFMKFNVIASLYLVQTDTHRFYRVTMGDNDGAWTGIAYPFWQNQAISIPMSYIGSVEGTGYSSGALFPIYNMWQLWRKYIPRFRPANYTPLVSIYFTEPEQVLIPNDTITAMYNLLNKAYIWAQPLHATKHRTSHLTWATPDFMNCDSWEDAWAGIEMRAVPVEQKIENSVHTLRPGGAYLATCHNYTWKTSHLPDYATRDYIFCDTEATKFSPQLPEMAGFSTGDFFAPFLDGVGHDLGAPMVGPVKALGTTAKAYYENGFLGHSHGVLCVPGISKFNKDTPVYADYGGEARYSMQLTIVRDFENCFEFTDN